MIYYGMSSTQNGVGVPHSATSPLSECYVKVTEIVRLTDRIISLKIELGATTDRVISCYALQTECPDNKKNEFWDWLDAPLEELFIILGGNLNGHVGSKGHGYVQCHGRHGLGIQNNDGWLILDCAEAHDLTVTNIYFKKRPLF